MDFDCDSVRVPGEVWLGFTFFGKSLVFLGWKFFWGMFFLNILGFCYGFCGILLDGGILVGISIFFGTAVPEVTSTIFTITSNFLAST